MDNFPNGLIFEFLECCKDCNLCRVEVIDLIDIMGKKESIITCLHKEVCEKK